MPTKFRLELQDPLKSNIAGQTLAIRAKRTSGEFCSYPQFVENLGKEMNTAADELHHHTTGMCGEAGELLDATKKVWVYGKAVDVEHLIEEMGDLRWYYQSMLNMLGLTDEDIQAANTVKLMKRYPTGVYSNEQAIARADKVDAAPARKFMGMPPKEPKTLDDSSHVSSEQKPVEEGLEIPAGSALDMQGGKINRHAELHAKLRDALRAEQDKAKGTSA